MPRYELVSCDKRSRRLCQLYMLYQANFPLVMNVTSPSLNDATYVIFQMHYESEVNSNLSVYEY